MHGNLSGLRIHVYARGSRREHLSPPEQQTISWYDLVLLSETGRSEPITDLVSTEVLIVCQTRMYHGYLMVVPLARRKVAVTVTTATRRS